MKTEAEIREMIEMEQCNQRCYRDTRAEWLNAVEREKLEYHKQTGSIKLRLLAQILEMPYEERATLIYGEE